MSKYLLILFTFFLLSFTLVAQPTDSLFYGNTPTIFENPFGWGYMTGTNEYNDIGKYQRFDVYDDAYILGARLYFALVEIANDPDSIYVVVRGVGPEGQPAELKTRKGITTDIIPVGLEGIYVEFDEPIHVQGMGFIPDTIFIGFEWALTANDTFAVYADADGEGDNENRAWERFNDGTFNDFLPLLFNPTFSWNIDTDLWIKAYYTTTPPSSVDDKLLLNTFSLEQNYPNPFNPETRIIYTIAENSLVTLKVFDILGNEVALLVNEQKESGIYEVMFDASELSSGVYFYTLSADKFITSKKMILIK